MIQKTCNSLSQKCYLLKKDTPGERTGSRSSRSQTSVLKNFVNSTGKHLCLSLLARNYIKKRLQYRCIPVKFTKFLRTLFLQSSCSGCSSEVVAVFVRAVIVESVNFIQMSKQKIIIIMMENSYVIIKKYISKGIAEKWDPRPRTQNLGSLSETKDLKPP